LPHPTPRVNRFLSSSLRRPPGSSAARSACPWLTASTSPTGSTPAAMAVRVPPQPLFRVCSSVPFAPPRSTNHVSVCEPDSVATVSSRCAGSNSCPSTPSMLPRGRPPEIDGGRVVGNTSRVLGRESASSTVTGRPDARPRPRPVASVRGLVEHPRQPRFGSTSLAATLDATYRLP